MMKNTGNVGKESYIVWNVGRPCRETAGPRDVFFLSLKIWNAVCLLILQLIGESEP